VLKFLRSLFSVFNILIKWYDEYQIKQQVKREIKEAINEKVKDATVVRADADKLDDSFLLPPEERRKP